MLYTDVPHIYFTANAPKYSTRTEKSENHFVKVMTIPDYSRTQSMVLLDLETLQSYEVSFGKPRMQEEVDVLLESGQVPDSKPEKKQVPMQID